VRAATSIFTLGAWAVLAVACSRGGPSAEAVPAPPPPAPEAEIPDARAEYESRGFLRGSPRSLAGASSYLAAAGDFLAGPLATSRADIPLVAARRTESGAELVLIDAEEKVRATSSLPGRPLELAVSGARLLASSAEGSLICFAMGGGAADGEGAPLRELWRKKESPAERLLVLPADRIAVARDDGIVSSIDIVSGAEAWESKLGFFPSDLAYSKGSIIACGEKSVVALMEEGGGLAWKDEMAAPARLLSAGDGLVALIDGRGRLTFLDAKDGRVLSEAAGPFDAAIRPLIDSGSGFAALPGGGAAQVDARTGELSREWSWRGSCVLLAIDEGAIYSASGTRLIVRDRYADSPAHDLALPSPALGSLVRLESGDGLLALGCRDGISVIGARASALDAALVPAPSVAQAIEGAIAGLGGAWNAAAPPRYGPFVSGIPVYPQDGFVVLRYEPGKTGKRSLAATPDPGDAVIALFDEAGRKIGSNVDELGTAGRLEHWFEDGEAYWIAAGGRGGSPEGGGYRLLLR
jgi:hypothetical protein